MTLYLQDDPNMVGGNQAWQPIQDRADVLLSIRLLAKQLIKTALRDIGKKKYRAAALRWVNAVHEDSVTSFSTCCDLLGHNAGYLRARINRFAETGQDISHYNLKTRRKRTSTPGRKKNRRCEMPGCNQMTAGRLCERCKRVFYSRRYNHPDEPHLWMVPVQRRGGGQCLQEIAARAQ